MMSIICFSQNRRYVSAVSYLSRSSLGTSLTQCRVGQCNGQWTPRHWDKQIGQAGVPPGQAGGGPKEIHHLAGWIIERCTIFRIDMAEGAKFNPLKASADVEGYKARHQTCDGELLAHDDAVTFCPCLRVSSLLLSRLGGKQRTVTLPVRLSLRIIGNTIESVSQKHSYLQDDARHVTSFWGQITVCGWSTFIFLHFWLVKSENKSIKASSTH